MRLETVMLSTRISPRLFGELKRIEKDRVFYTRSKLVKEALELLVSKYPPPPEAPENVPPFVGNDEKSSKEKPPVDKKKLRKKAPSEKKK